MCSHRRVSNCPPSCTEVTTDFFQVRLASEYLACTVSPTWSMSTRVNVGTCARFMLRVLNEGDDFDDAHQILAHTLGTHALMQHMAHSIQQDRLETLDATRMHAPRITRHVRADAPGYNGCRLSYLVGRDLYTLYLRSWRVNTGRIAGR